MIPQEFDDFVVFQADCQSLSKILRNQLIFGFVSTISKEGAMFRNSGWFWKVSQEILSPNEDEPMIT